VSDYRVPVTQPTFEAVFFARETGIAAQIAFKVDDNAGNTVIGPFTGTMTEINATGIYRVNITTPATEGSWTVIYSKDATFDPVTNAYDYLVTYDPGSAQPDVPPLTPVSADGILAVGPCDSWTTPELVAECCGLDLGTDLDPLDGPIVAASQVLYELSGKRFPGTCTERVRPCTNGGSCLGPWQNWSGVGWIPWAWAVGGDAYGFDVAYDFGVYGNWGAWGEYGNGCGCTPLSRVPLAGKAREILEVTIDGQIVDPLTYRLDARRWLTRVPDPADPDVTLRWPSCQDMSLPYTDEGTFSVYYAFGDDPPVVGTLAAQELACAIYQTCSAGGSPEGDCSLPTNVTKIQRQGVTIDLAAFSGWGRDSDGIWRTGLPLTDMFLNTYNPQGLRRKSRVWWPERQRFPRQVGESST
jgi:hypothetical protein